MTEYIISSSIFIAAIVILRFLLWGKISRRLQYALWLLVLIRLFMPFPMLESGFSVMNALKISKAGVSNATLTPFLSQADVTSEVLKSADLNQPAPKGETPDTESSFKPYLTFDFLSKAVWLTGSIITALWLFGINFKFYKSLKSSRKIFDNTSHPPIYISSRVLTPCLFGILRPAIYLPEAVTKNELSLKYALLHELCHYRHGDHIWSVLRGLCLAVNWWNPLILLAAVLSRNDSELASDEAVIRKIGHENRLDYGRALVSMIPIKESSYGILSAATAMSSGKRGISERLNMIVKNPKTFIPGLIIALAVVALFAASTFTGAKSKSEESLSYAEKLYNARNPYIGDASADTALLKAVNVSEILGDYTIELETENEPYVLRIISSSPLNNADTPDIYMNGKAALLLALIDNASKIEWQYASTENSVNYTRSMTVDEANAYINGDIKAYGASVEKIKELLLIIEPLSSVNNEIKEMAKDYINKELENYETMGVKILENKIVGLRPVARYESMLSYPVEVWLLEYRLLPEDINKVVFAGGMQEENGWITEYSSMAQPCLIISYESGKPSYMGNTWSANFYEEGGKESALRGWLERNGYLPEETYPGKHALVYFFLSDGTKAHLVLSKPVRQDDTGIWCVERWYDDYGNKYIASPDNNVLAADYYKELQKLCDNGHRPGLLDPEDVALLYINETIGQNVTLDGISIVYTD